MLVSWLASGAGRSSFFSKNFNHLLTQCQRALHVNNAGGSQPAHCTSQRAQQKRLEQAQTPNAVAAACAWQHTVQHRFFSAAAAAQSQPLTLKTALRQLYKRVHPDLFADYPAEQVTPNWGADWIPSGVAQQQLGPESCLCILAGGVRASILCLPRSLRLLFV